MQCRHASSPDAVCQFWEALQDLGVPLYIHPNPVPSNEWKVLQGYPGLGHATWGWNHRTGGHALRLIFGGVAVRVSPRAVR
jgi:2,3-dihydroxybenzoate decarboxylase